MDMLITSGLGKDYGTLTAVKGLDLTVAKGEIFGLLGPNGAGKTTAISMICGVVTPTRGTARVAGHDIAGQPYAARRALGLVPQDLAIYDDLSARQNLRFFGRVYGLRGSLLSERVAWALDVAGLADRAGEAVKRYSGGMKRRLNLAAGLLHKPPLLVLDEPTVGVDPQSRNYIFETVRALNRDHGMTVIYTSHYMEEVQSLCERVAIMDHGELIALDRVEDLIRAHGRGMIELELEPASGDAGRDPAGDPPGDPDGAFAAAVRALAGVIGDIDDSGVMPERRAVRFDPGDRLGAAITALEQAGHRLRSVHTLEADLEAIFLSLTGHRLRDE